MQAPPGKPSGGNVCPKVRQLRCSQVGANRSLEAICVIIAFFCGQAVRIFGGTPFRRICHIDQ
jgi:hypothetical protein